MRAPFLWAFGFRRWLLGLGLILTFFLYPSGGGLLGFFLLLLIEAFSVPARRAEAALAIDAAHLWFKWLLLFAVISSLQATRPGIGFLVTLGFSLLIWGGLAVGCSLAQRDGLYERRLLPAITAGVALSAVATLVFAALHPGNRAHTLWTGENGTGTALVLGTGLALGYFLSLKNAWRWPLLIGFTVLAAVAVVSTLSRGAWLGFMAMLLVMMRHSRRLVAVLVLVTLVMAMGMGFVPLVRERAARVFSLERNQDRLELWQTALTMIKNRPVFGVGPGNFSDSFPDYGYTSRWGGAPAYAHNLFLQVAVETGLVGLVIFVAITGRVGLILYRLANRSGPAYWGLEAAFWGTLVHQQVDIPIWGAAIGSAWWLLIGFAVATYAKSAFIPSPLERTETAQGAVFGK